MSQSRRKFSRSEDRSYTRSNAVAAIRVPPHPLLRTRASAVAVALTTEERARVELASQHLIDLLCLLLRVRRLKVEVCGARPTNSYGELHGLYTPANGNAARDRVQVWMRTARRLQVVAYKTFLRTLLHELCHHLDYEYLKLDHSFHTEGFYRRESSLVYQVTPRGDALTPRPLPAPSAVERRT